MSTPDFKSDGCTLFPDLEYGSCCINHDRAYFEGGSYEERRRADIKLMRCVAWHGRPILAFIMYLGVRVFGAPFWPTGRFRWGNRLHYRHSFTYKRQKQRMTCEDQRSSK